MDEFIGPRAVDEQNRADGTYEDGVVFYLAGPHSKAFTPGQINRAAHFCGGRLQTRVANLGTSYSVSIWFWNGMPIDSRPVLGWMFGRGQNYSDQATGDALGLNTKGQLIFANGQEALTGKAAANRWKWHHALLVRDKEKVQVYLDGKLEISGEAKIISNVETLFLGGRNSKESSWEGRLDEAAVFDRALSEKEIKALFLP